MKKALFALVAVAGLACSASAQVVISQVYGGGGNSGAPFNQDFVELHNNGTSSVTVPAGGWSVQYGSATGNFGSSAGNIIAIPENTVIPAGGYVLVGGASGANGSALPATDFGPSASGNFNMSGTNGKVALVTGTTSVGNANCGDARILDVVGYGSASCGEGTNVAVLSNTTAALRNADGCADTNNNSADFSVVTPSPRNSGSAAFVCSGFVDCNNNGVSDATDIANGTSQDCNTDGVPDECQIAGADCNGNGQLDSCEIAANPALDCNQNGSIDSCEIATNPFIDSCNSNGIIDTCETPGPGEDCNGNGIIDCWDFKVAVLTDVDGNGTPDACEGAAVVEASLNATVQTAGVRAGSNNDAFVNVEGSLLGAFASYGGIRWDLAAIAAQLDTVHGAGQWQADKVYLYLQQANAAFTLSSLTDAMQLYYTNNDTQDLTNGNTNTIYPNFATDFADRDLIRNYTFTQGSGGPFGDGSGTIETYLMFDLAGSNNTASTSVAGEVNAGSGTLTMLINTTDDFAAATYAGRTNTSWRGPTIVVFGQPTGPSCDPDVNCDGVPDQDDVACIILAVAGDMSCFCQADPDFNGDGVPDQGDVADVILTVAGAPCP